MAETTVLFTSDIHGSEVCWRKFLNSAAHFGAGVLLLGGDVTGKAIVPLVVQGDGRYRVRWEGDHLVGEDDLPAWERRIADAGCYGYRCDTTRLSRLNEDPAERTNLFNHLIAERVEAWMRLAEERLASTRVECLVMPGNDDEEFVARAIATSSYVRNPEDTIVSVAGMEMLSIGLSNKTPWDSPREVSEEVLAEHIDRLAGDIQDMSRAIFNIHVPPYGTAIDQAPLLDPSMKPVVAGGSVQMGPAGSKAVHAAIDRYQPLLGLHGHIHEARGAVKLGRTVCINPGSQYGDGILDAFLIKVDTKGGLKGYQYISG